MTAKIILNPYAGRWKAQAAIPEIERCCREIGLEIDLVVTDEPGHGIELAQKAVQEGFSPVVAAGGDGTISEVMNGLLAAAGSGSVCPLGIIPLGSADDLADMLDLDKTIETACRSIQAEYVRTIDVGCVNGRYFDNNSAVGLEPVVTLTQAAMKYIKGTPRYVLAALKAIASHRPWQAKLTWDDGAYEGPIVLASIGNTRRTGGTFYMTPEAAPDDGFLDLVFAARMSRLRLLKLLPSTFDGSHVDQAGITYVRTRQVTIECDPPTPIQADGEVFETAATQIDYSIQPGRLPVIVPAQNGDSHD